MKLVRTLLTLFSHEIIHFRCPRAASDLPEKKRLDRMPYHLSSDYVELNNDDKATILERAPLILRNR